MQSMPTPARGCPGPNYVLRWGFVVGDVMGSGLGPLIGWAGEARYSQAGDGSTLAFN